MITLGADQDIAQGRDAPPNRAQGVLRASFSRVGRRTGPARVYEAGGLRMRFPKGDPNLAAWCEAVCINTGGGMVGGDTAQLAFTCEPGAQTTLTTQSAEKIYRGEQSTTEVAVDIEIGAGARAEWLPQETILFDRARLKRRLDVRMDETASLLLAETLVFGRQAMGETVVSGALRDRWRIHRGRRLVFAEELRVEGPVAATLDRAALGNGARALATLLLVDPDAETKLDAVRTVLVNSEVEAGASAWNGLLSVRACSPSPDRVRALMVAVLLLLRGRPAPRVWQ